MPRHQLPSAALEHQRWHTAGQRLGYRPAQVLSSGNPFWVILPTLPHFHKLSFDTAYPELLWNTVVVSIVSTLASLVASVLAAYAIERLRFSGTKQVGLSISSPT